MNDQSPPPSPAPVPLPLSRPEANQEFTASFQRRWRLHRGAAGLIVVILVLGYLMSISSSFSLLVQSEIQGRTTRDNYKKAYYAAIAGVHFVLARLRADPKACTFDPASPPLNRLFFSQNPNDGNPHYCTWTATMKEFNSPAVFLRVAGMDRYCCTTAMSINTDANPNSYTFVVSSYPGPNPQEDYYIKSQGSFYDSEILATTTAQVWAYARIDTPLENVNLIRFGPMPIQPLSLDSAAGVNDFWDWERF